MRFCTVIFINRALVEDNCFEGSLKGECPMRKSSLMAQWYNKKIKRNIQEGWRERIGIQFYEIVRVRLLITRCHFLFKI